MRIIPFEEFIRRYHSGQEFVLFDTETTGLNTYHDDIIEVAGMIWKKGQPPRTFQELIRVNLNRISQGAWDVHQIPPEEIEKAASASDVLGRFVDFCGGRPLVAHNIRFDYDMLNYNLIRSGLLPYANDEVVCSLAYAKEQSKPGKLSELANHYKVKTQADALHRALYDVEVLSEVLGRMAAEHEPAEMQYSLIL